MRTDKDKTRPKAALSATKRIIAQRNGDYVSYRILEEQKAQSRTPQLKTLKSVASSISGNATAQRGLQMLRITLSALLRLPIICFLSVLLAAPLIAAPVDLELDIAYGKDHPNQRLDLYLPTASKGFATVVFVHGGSLQTGDKRDDDYGKVCPTFVSAGVACASINYRFLQNAPWPASADDTAAAFAWTKRNIASRNGDPARIFLVGHSSGARLVATIASDEQFAQRAGFALADIRGVVVMGSIMRDQDFEDQITKAPPAKILSAFATDPEYRAYGTPERYRESWPLHHIHTGIPPVLFIIAEHEEINPPVLASAQEFIAAVTRVGGHAYYKIVPGRHMDEVHNLGAPGDLIQPAILEFIQRPDPR
jgi:acetyl esterase/lipase